MNKVIWKDIPGFEGKYQASNQEILDHQNELQKQISIIEYTGLNLGY